MSVLTLVGTSAALAVLGVPEPAQACGGFFSARAPTDERRPALAYEQALVVFDAERGREHFLREVVFRSGGERFGFVVPTPTRPEVASVRVSPFERLRTLFPFEEPVGGDAPRGAVAAGRGVTVLEVKRVGSFTSFVLAADDPTALAGWLTREKLTSTPQADAWLAHYVAMGFYYVAMRYDPPPGETAPRDRAETVRISFDTPLPYYPYREPDPPDPEPSSEPRMLELWLVSSRRFVPVAAQRRSDSTTWVRPFAEGQRFAPASRSSLESALGEERGLLPAGELVMQRFMDQKRSRRGYGDVVFVPDRPVPLDDAGRARLAPLLPLLDPSLEGSRDAADGGPDGGAEGGR
jgi:hypothetical protein